MMSSDTVRAIILPENWTNNDVERLVLQPLGARLGRSTVKLVTLRRVQADKTVASAHHLCYEIMEVPE